MSAKYDDIDVRIVKELQDDGRRPVRLIARNLNMPEATIRLRLRRLQDQGLLNILAYADPIRFGHSKPGLVLARTRPRDHDTIVETLHSWSEVAYLSTMIGGFDLCIQVLVADDAGLLAITRRIRNLKGIEAVQIFPELEVHKLFWRLSETPLG